MGKNQGNYRGPVKGQTEAAAPDHGRGIVGKAVAATEPVTVDGVVIEERHVEYLREKGQKAQDVRTAADIIQKFPATARVAFFAVFGQTPDFATPPEPTPEPDPDVNAHARKPARGAFGPLDPIEAEAALGDRVFYHPTDRDIDMQAAGSKDPLLAIVVGENEDGSVNLKVLPNRAHPPMIFVERSTEGKEPGQFSYLG